MSKRALIAISLLVMLVLLAACTVTPAGAPAAPAAPAKDKLVVFGAYATAIEEPWDGVIHAALNKAKDGAKSTTPTPMTLAMPVTWNGFCRKWPKKTSPTSSSATPLAMKKPCAAWPPSIRKSPSSLAPGGGPAEPNFSVFDNWIHEPAYLSGMLAGGLTKSNVIGVVGGLPVPEVNRIVNAFIAGATAVNPEVDVKTTFINSWFDPAAAKEAALAQIDAGADVLFAERFGVIEAAAEKGLYSFGNMSDQKELAPESVVSGPVWNMNPTVEYIVSQVKAGAYTAQDLKDFSMVAKGGASPGAHQHGVTGGIPQELIDQVTAKERKLRAASSASISMRPSRPRRARVISDQ